MGLHPGFFIVTVVGWIFGVLGVVYDDATARDAGILVAMGALAVGFFLESDTMKAIRAGRAARAPAHAARHADESGLVHPAPKASAREAEAPVTIAPARDVVRPPVHRASEAWESGDFGFAKPPAAPPAEPIALAPGNGNGHAVPAAPAAPERLTRGMCGKCQSPITVSSRRPIRVTCPVCGHSKLLQ